MIITHAGHEREALKGIYTPRDFEALCSFEDMHRALIKAPEKVKKNEVFEVRVEVGERAIHPNEPGHFIEWIEAYYGPEFLFRVNLSSFSGEPRVAVPVKLRQPGGSLRVWYKCNLHGIGDAAKDIEVEQ
ncbi:MAG: desulfoferrodoxin family protein [Endomicrobiales bacterium]